MPKLVACMPVRNEEWILEKTLTDLSEYVDEIVMVDDGSSDRTPDIIRSFPKVTQVHTNPPETLPFNNGQESDNRNKCLQMARAQGADWILQIDADEMFEHRIREELPKLMDKGCSIKFEVCHFWEDTKTFRRDGDWGGFYRYRLYQLKPRTRFSEQPIIATPRAFERKKTYVSDVKILHYGWLNRTIRLRSLRRYFEVYKLKYPQKNVGLGRFLKSEKMQSDLRILQQEGEVKTASWSDIVKSEYMDKYNLKEVKT